MEHAVHTGSIPLVKLPNWIEITKKWSELKHLGVDSKINVKFRILQTQSMFPGVCGHFALGTFSNTYLKNVVFEIHIFTTKEKTLKIVNSPKVKFATNIIKLCLNQHIAICHNIF